MADDRGSGADRARADIGNPPKPGPSTALRIWELMESDSGAGEWARWLNGPLEHAVSRGDEDLTAALLDAGANPCFLGRHGVSILGVAAREGHVGIVSAIATRHPRTLSQTALHSGYFVLHHAAKHNKVDSIDALVKARAALELKDAKGCTALHVAAATAGCEAAVEALLRHGADKEQKNAAALTPLLEAVHEGNEAAATVLIEAGASLVGGHNDEKTLEVAISGGYVKDGVNRAGCISIMRTLVERGLDVSFNGGGGTAMHWAAWYNNGDAVDFLVEMGADVEAKGYDGSTPFHVAVIGAGNLEAIRALARHGADANARRPSGDTPLHMAVNNGFSKQAPATVDALLRAGADETTVSAASETPAEALETRVQQNGHGEDDVVQQIRKLLANAPADRANRAWARRSFVVMCRAFPGRVRLLGDLSAPSPTIDSTTSSLKAVPLKADEGEPSSREEGANRDSPNPGDFSGAMGSLIGLQAEVFRAIVEFL